MHLHDFYFAFLSLYHIIETTPLGKWGDIQPQRIETETEFSSISNW